jgi:hypothetical protein
MYQYYKWVYISFLIRHMVADSVALPKGGSRPAEAGCLKLMAINKNRWYMDFFVINVHGDEAAKRVM